MRDEDIFTFSLSGSRAFRMLKGPVCHLGEADFGMNFPDCLLMSPRHHFMNLN